MIYDCFLFNNELDLLEIRCEELKHLEEVVHVLVESNMTFTGNRKPAHFLESESRFDNYNIRPIFVDGEEMIHEETPWDRERFQRNALVRGLEDAEDDDIIIISDADEIPRALTVDQYKTSMGLVALKMDKFGYYLNCMEGRQTWDRARIMPYSLLKHTSPEEIRNGGFNAALPDAGWHWSYLGGVDAILDKLSSFSHQEESVQRLNNREIMKKKYDSHQSLWGDDYWQIVEINEAFPAYLQGNESKFSHLIRPF